MADVGEDLEDGAVALGREELRVAQHRDLVGARRERPPDQRLILGVLVQVLPGQVESHPAVEHLRHRRREYPERRVQQPGVREEAGPRRAPELYAVPGPEQRVEPRVQRRLAGVEVNSSCHARGEPRPAGDDLLRLLLLDEPGGLVQLVLQVERDLSSPRRRC